MITQAYLNRLEKIESSGKGDAQNPNSSAKGYFQFIDSTAKEYGLLGDGFDYRGNKSKEIEAVTEFTRRNYSSLKGELGREPTNGELYLAHQQGAGGALKILSGDPEQKAIEVLGRDQVLNNGGSEEMTLGEFRQRWTGKFAELDQTSEPIELPDLYDALDVKTGDYINKDGSNSADLPDLYDLVPQMSGSGQDEFINVGQGGDLSKKRINKESGAPSFVRAVVGSASSPQDRLETLKKYYPDAQPYDDNNFIYTNPDNGEVTLYNPKGLGRGDFSSIAREGAITVASGIGTAIGAAGALALGQLGPQAAVLEEFVTVPAFGSAGGALGAGIGANAFDGLMNLFGLRVDTRTPAQVALQTGAEMTAAAGGEIVGPFIAPAAKGLIGGGKQTLKNTVELFEKVGVTPTAATSGLKTPASIQGALAKSPLTADKVAEVAQRQIKETNQAINKVISRFGTAKTKQGAGGAIQDAAKNVAVRFRNRQTEIYDDVFEQIGPETKASVNNVVQLKKEINEQIQKAPKTLGPLYRKMVDELDNIVADASMQGSEGIEFATLRQIRTAVGKRMNDPSLVETGALAQTQLDMLYSALTLDISEAAARSGDDVARKLKVADRYTRTFMKNSAKTFDKIHKFDAEERAFKFATAAANDGGSSLALLRRNFEPEEWDTVAASVLRKLGDPLDDGSYSIAKFLNNYKKLAPEAKQALFGGKRYVKARESLAELNLVLEKLKDVEKYANPSGTAAASYTINALDALGAGAGSVIGGALTGGAGAGAGFGAGYAATQGLRVLSPKVALKLVTTPAFVKWLAEPVNKGVVDTAKHTAKLFAIAEANKAIADEIFEYSVILEENTKGLE